MSFLICQLKFGKLCLHDRSKLIKLWTISYSNLISAYDSIKKNCYSTRTDLSLPENDIKKFLNTITTAYTTKENHNNDLLQIRQTRELLNLLENRLCIMGNIKSLEELGQQDEEMSKLANEELIEYTNSMTELDEALLHVVLNSFGRSDCHDIILEVTAGAGGQEAMLFTAELLNMYRKYVEYLGFNHELIEMDAETGIGGIRHASISISGRRVFELLRYEGGVHRVQRVPATDKYGRMHTSTSSVVVLPQPRDIDVNLKDNDLKIETKRSSGAGGQSVNTTDSAVRITHLPSGVVVESQSERSQIQNKKIAMLKLRTKIFNIELNKQKTMSGSLRKEQRGMSERNEKIRTYNYSQDRITDHRLINGTLHNLKGFMEGGESLKNLQERLQRNFQLKLLQEAIEKCK